MDQNLINAIKIIDATKLEIENTTTMAFPHKMLVLLRLDQIKDQIFGDADKSDEVEG